MGGCYYRSHHPTLIPNTLYLTNCLIGDGPAIQEAMGMKSPGNAKTPCRFCLIRAKKAPNKHYYVPHKERHLQDTGLPMRSNLRAQIEAAVDSEDCTWLTKLGMYFLNLEFGIANYPTYTGVTRKSILLELDSIHYPRSFTVDLMHCILLNIMKNLFLLWHGEKLTADEEDPAEYVLPTDDTMFLHEVLRTSRANIPAALGTLPSSLRYYKQFKAAEWKAILELYGPALMYDHIPDDAHLNFCNLSDLWSRSIQRSISTSDLGFIKAAATKFVQDYEAIYYHGDPNRIPACSINNHWLLHLGSCIQDNGPARYWWSFPIERYCYEVKKMARSKQYLGKSILNTLIRREQLNAIQLREYQGNTHPDRDDQQDYPVLSGLISDPHQHDDLPLSNSMVRRLIQQTQYGDEDEIDLQYFRRCKLSSEVTIGSKASQYESLINRDSHFVCYHGPRGGCRFGTVYGFILISGLNAQYALIRLWRGVEADMARHQIIYSTEGPLDLVAVARIRCLVGILTEVNRADERRVTKMILGAIPEVRSAGGIEQV
jgi:hypothetical protein